LGKKLARAYTLINVKPGKDKEICDEIRKIKNVIEAHAVAGVYDIVAVLEVKDFDELGQIVIGQIRPIENVEKTATLVQYY